MANRLQHMPEVTRLALKEAARNAHYELNDLGLPVTSLVGVKARNVIENLLLSCCPDGALFPLIMALKQSETISDIIQRVLGVSADEVVPTAGFINDLGADSLDTIELIMEVEKAYNVAIPDDMAENVKTVQDLQDLVDKAQAGQQQRG